MYFKYRQLDDDELLAPDSSDDDELSLDSSDDELSSDSSDDEFILPLIMSASVPRLEFLWVLLKLQDKQCSSSSSSHCGKAKRTSSSNRCKAKVRSSSRRRKANN